MDFESAIKLLNTCKRDELRDHAFGDREVYWMKDGKEVAFGYFGSTRGVHIYDGGTDTNGIRTAVSFNDDEAVRLSECGASATYARNDTTGPDMYQDGVCMPGLTLEGVRKELEGESD